MAKDFVGIAQSYQNLGAYLVWHNHQLIEGLACHLSASLILAAAHGGGADVALRAVASDLRGLGGSSPEMGLADLYRLTGAIPGTNMPGLITTLFPDPEASERALRDLTAHARALAFGS